MSSIETGATEGLFELSSLLEKAGTLAGVNNISILDTAGLRALTYSLACSSERMNFIGRNRAQKMLLECLVKRLRAQHHLDTHPEIRDIAIEKPIFLVAPFRTGTTFLHRLLAQDTDHRTPRLWESLQAPPLEPLYQNDPAYFEQDPRIAIAKKYIEARARLTPDIAEIHPTSVDAPEECFGLLETSLLSHSFTFYAPVMEYLDWLDAQSDDNWRQAYQLYADQIRLLQWWAPAKRWVLKTPFHMWAVDALAHTFPDALIVQQHRKPATCVASYCSLIVSAYRPIVSKVDHKMIGQIALRFLRDAVQRNVAARQNLPSDQFIDIDYAALTKDPIGVVRRVYDAAGLTLSSEKEKLILDWQTEQAASRKGKHHEYTLDAYGLDEDEVNAAFSDYSAYSLSD